MDIVELSESYKRGLRRRKCSTMTLDRHDAAVAKMLAFGGVTSKADAEAFLDWMYEQGLADWTVVGYWNDLTRFYAWLGGRRNWRSLRSTRPRAPGCERSGYPRCCALPHSRSTPVVHPNALHQVLRVMAEVKGGT